MTRPRVPVVTGDPILALPVARQLPREPIRRGSAFAQQRPACP